MTTIHSESAFCQLLNQKIIFLTLSGLAFSVVHQAQGWGLMGQDDKSQRCYQLIKMKFCVSHYSHKSMSLAKSETDSFSSFGDITSQHFSFKKGTCHRIGIFTVGKSV